MCPCTNNNKRRSSTTSNISLNTGAKQKFTGQIKGVSSKPSYQLGFNKDMNKFLDSTPTTDFKTQEYSSEHNHTHINLPVKMQKPPNLKLSINEHKKKQNRSRDNIKVEETGIIGEQRKHMPTSISVNITKQTIKRS